MSSGMQHAWAESCFGPGHRGNPAILRSHISVRASIVLVSRAFHVRNIERFLPNHLAPLFLANLTSLLIRAIITNHVHGISGVRNLK